MNRRIIRYVILLLAVLMIAVGAWQSGYLDTLQRATVICLECIGIG